MRVVFFPPGTHRFNRSSFFQDDGVGVILAIVAALAAILLAHGRHETARQRPAFGELHALAKRHRRIMPGICPSSPSSSGLPRAVAAPVPMTWFVSAVVSSDDSALTPPSSDKRPAKKPSSQVRCSAENGASSGMSVGIGGGVVA